MANVKQPPAGAIWPWGAPRTVRDRLVRPGEFDRKKAGKKGNPKDPSLASAELLDSIGPAHSADELRLPLPPLPTGHDAELANFNDRPFMQAAADRADPELRAKIEQALSTVNASAERVERLKSLLNREGQMLTLVSQINDEMREILRRMWEEQKDEGF